MLSMETTAKALGLGDGGLCRMRCGELWVNKGSPRKTGDAKKKDRL